MALSYPLRVVCVVGVSFALLLAAVEVLLWAAAPAILRLVRVLTLRQRERTLYAVQMLPPVVALVLTACFFVPEYVSNETNLLPERVSLLCILLSAGLFAAVGYKLFRGAQIAVRTMLFTRACRLESQPLAASAGQTPILTVTGDSPRIALVGLLRPFILISRSLVEDGGLDPAALQIVLDHERSHAAQRDNWKLLSLHCVPRLALPLHGGKSWMKLWQSAAEWAADEDAVDGNSARAFQLAETLVALARAASSARPEIACTYLVCPDSDLASRVELLIQHRPASSARSASQLGMALGFAAAGAAALLLTLASALRDLPEHLLHLG